MSHDCIGKCYQAQLLLHLFVCCSALLKDNFIFLGRNWYYSPQKRQKNASTIPLSLCSNQLNGKVFCYQVSRLEHNHHIYFKLYFEIVSGQCRAGEETRKNHVEWNRQPSADIPLCNLNVLNLRRLNLHENNEKHVIKPTQCNTMLHNVRMKTRKMRREGKGRGRARFWEGECERVGEGEARRSKRRSTGMQMQKEEGRASFRRTSFA